MAETKNTFIKSKMNQDLDQRLVPNGEYREGFNISVSQAEGADVGTLETVLGNVLVTDLDLSSTCNAEIIGNYVDDQNKTIYLFVTNFVDTSSDKVSNYPPDTVLCQIWRRNVETNINTKLVEGKFLNFSLTHPIMGVNLIEDLLFWTDNRNQPRKINVNSANPNNLTAPTYYSNDDQINVAKYYPYEPISLIKDYIVDFTIFSKGTGSPQYDQYVNEVVPTSAIGASGLTVEILGANATTGELEQIRIVNQGQGYYNGQYVTIGPKIGNAQIQLVVEEASTMKDKCTEKLPVNCTYLAGATEITAGTGTGTPYTLGALQSGTAISSTVDYTGALIKINAGAATSPYLARVIAQNPIGPTITVAWANKYTTGPVYFPDKVSGITSIEIGINPDYDANWPGDCQFLKDKFVRFAYRFKFNDNEYSLISPFTQPCFIPKQNGYFLSEDRDGVTVLDTEKAYEDTDNNVMQNMVTNVDLQIPCPEFLDDSISNTFNNIQNELHVTDIEIIYKDDAENSLKVVDNITAESFSNLDFNTLIYNYQSRKPKKTLPSSEITRVSDKVPIRALAQEVTGNRVVYGNYVDGYTAMNTLDYEVSANEKSEDTSLRKEYQNHTLKQNRSYQVGIVLVDRYGRSSDVILSSLDVTTSTANAVFSGSTVFHPFYSSGEKAMIEASSTWNGDSLRVKFNSKIPLTIPQAGYPGLFLGYITDPISNLYSGAGYLSSKINLTTTGGTGTGLTVNITIDVSKFGGPPPLGKVQSVTINDPGIGYKQGDVITITGGLPSINATFVYNPSSQPNLTGWYSYKIVVKQTEQDYYNVYLPGIVNGSLNTDGLDSVTTANVSLFADNINKVPKDLTTVGPSQTNYNSTENLSLRVNNTIDFSSIQNYPGTVLEKVTQISELTDLGVNLDRISLEQHTTTATNTDDTIEYETFNEKIQPGMAIISVIDSSGAEVINSSDGFYVKSYFTSTSSRSKVKLNKELGLSITVQAGDIWTFGPPGVVYNSGNNPLIGILSTSKKIGVSEQDGFKTQLAVAETTPVESLLDIYYETTSSGSISDLNLAISQGISAIVPVKTTSIVFDLNESQTGAVVCTNTFNLLSSSNTDIIGKNIEGEIVSVFDKDNNDRTSEFNITDDNNGTFSIVTTNVLGKGYYIKQSENTTTFDFNLLMTNDTHQIPVEFEGKINNERPVYQGTTGDDGSIVINKTGALFGRPSDNLLFECLNGSGDTSLNNKEIQWEIISAVVKSGENAERPSDLDDNQTWPIGFYDTAPDVPNTYEMYTGQDVISLFQFADSQQNYGRIRDFYATFLRFNGLQSIGDSFTETYLPEGGSGQGGFFSGVTGNYGYKQAFFSTPQLVKSITIELSLKAVDRSGSGQVAESNGPVSSSAITLTLTAE